MHQERTMKLVSFEIGSVLGPVRRIGAVMGSALDDDAEIADLNNAYGALLRESGDPRWREIADASLPADMIGFLEGGPPAMDRARRALDYARGSGEDDEGRQLVFRRRDVRLLAPVPRPRTLRDFSVYDEHMTKNRPTSEKQPFWYHFASCYKGNPDAVYGPDDPLPWPDFTDLLDPELELCAVVGRRGRNLSVEEAEDYIAGYTIFVDGSARDVQRREQLGPFKGKDFGTNLGPCLVTPDEFDEKDARVFLRVNGEEWYEGNTGHRRNFWMPQLVAYCSDEETIHPGDVIAAGTIGYSCSVDTGKWIKPGDVVELEIEGIGTMKLTARREKREQSYVRDGMQGMIELPEAAVDYPQKLKDGLIPNPFLQRG
jgi:2-keto-4-pentenoate hydratase/2-oxohepta-3-ene-1,7-dioic acid hydratase in catechol pathway